MRHRAKALVATASIAGLLGASATPSQATPSQATPSQATPSQATTQAAAGQNREGRPATAPVAAVSYDGQTLFTGLLLGFGPVADEFPALVSRRVEAGQPQSTAELIGLITAAVDRVDPTFFASFRDAVTSGDRVQVDRALRSAEQVLITALTDELGGSLRAGDPRINSAVAVVVTTVLEVVATVDVVSSVNIVIDVELVETVQRKPVPTPPGPSATARIDYEKRVDQVAETLAR